MRYVLIAACGICIVSICSNGYRAHIAGSVKEHIDDWHVLGTSKNIIVIIADGMQGSFVESVMNENAELRTAYTDFTLYSKALSPHVFTSYGIPAILHGSFYDWTKHTSTHEILDIAKKDNFVLDANVKEYQTQEFMNSNGLLFGSQKQYNISYYNYVDRVRFYLKIAASRILPITILQYIFGTNSDDSVVVPKKYDALNFLHDFANYATTSSQSASLIVHHSMLPHPPLVFTRDGGLIKQPIVGTYQQIKDEMYFTLQRYATLIQRLKQLGKWDSSLVIIVGDHGSHYEAKEDPYASVRGLSYFSVGSYNPVLIVKLPYASQSFTIDTRNVATTDVRSLIEYYLSLDNWRTQYVFPYGAMQSVWVTASPQKGKYEQYYSLADFQNLSRVTSIDSLPILFHSALTPSLQDYREARMHAYNEVSIVAPQGLLGAAMIGPVGAWLTDKPAWQFLQLDKKISGDIQINFIMYGLEIDDRPPQQELRFVVNNIPVGSVTVGRRGRYSLIIPKNIIDYKTRRLKIQIIPQNAVAPSDISKWNKDTKLSVFLSGFTVSEYHP